MAIDFDKNKLKNDLLKWGVGALASLVVGFLFILWLAPDFDKSVAYMSLALAIVITFFSIVQHLMSKHSLEWVTRQPLAKHIYFKSFNEHLSFFERLCSKDHDGLPDELFVTVSTLAYGMYGDKDDSDGLQVTEANTFISILDSWVSNSINYSNGNNKPQLHLGIWCKDEHKDIFGYNSESQLWKEENREQVFKVLMQVENLLDKLKGFNNSNKLRFDLTATHKTDARLFLGKSQSINGADKGFLAMFTPLTFDTVNKRDWELFGFVSENTPGVWQLEKYDQQLHKSPVEGTDFSRGALTSKALKSPLDFLLEWFGLDENEAVCKEFLDFRKKIS